MYHRRAAFYDFSEGDMSNIYSAANTYFGFDQAPLREIVRARRETYCGTIGAEFMYISDPGQKRWIQSRLESVRGRPQLAPEVRRRVLERVTAAETLEKYMHTRYVGQKRFSLEGGETLIAMMDELVQRAGAQGVEELVIGMAHRGRLNVLVNTLGKSPKDLFAEFEGKAETASHLARRREVPPRVLLGRLDPGRAGAPHARLQPVAPGDREPGRGGLGPGAPIASFTFTPRTFPSNNLTRNGAR